MASSDPRTATEGQWEDLIDKVKAKANLVDVPTIQMTTTDPGEGSALADGHFIAVYGGSTQVGTSDIADGAVTTTKLASGAVTSEEYNFTTEGATLVPANANLNSATYMNTGVYYCPSSIDGATITNNPSKAAFQMWVINLLANRRNNYSNANWNYFLRIMAHGTNENMYRQHVTRKSDGTWTYGTWTSEQYQAGDSFNIGEDVYLTGRQRYENNKKYIWATMFLEKSVRPGVSVSFTPSGYNEAFNESSGVMFSQNNPTTSQIVFTCNVSGPNRNIINFSVELVASSYPLNANHPCILHPSGTLNFT